MRLDIWSRRLVFCRIRLPVLRWAHLGTEALHVKNRLKVLRAGRDWSQADLAERLSVSRQTVNSIETGKYDPSLPLALKMGRLFGMRVEEIFMDASDEQ